MNRVTKIMQTAARNSDSPNAEVERFISSALVVPVVSREPGRLSVAYDFPEKATELRRSAATCMSKIGHPDRGEDLFDGLMSNRLKHDLCYVNLKSVGTVILIKESVYKQIADERKIIEQVHKEEVESAVMRGESVNDELVKYYRDKSSRVVVASKNSMEAM